MTTTLRIVLLTAVFLYFCIVIYLLKKNRLALRYTLLWLAMGVGMLLLVIFPHILDVLRVLFGFADGMNALFVCAIGFAFLLLLSITSIVSHQTEKIQSLVQENALLERRIRELEKKNE